MISQDLKAEQRLLGFLIENAEKFPEIQSCVRLRPNHFSLRGHQAIFQVIQRLYSESKDINMMSVSMVIHELGMQQQAPHDLIADLVNQAGFCFRLASVIHHAEQVVKYWQRREFLNVLQASAHALETSVTDYEEREEEVIDKIMDFFQKRNDRPENNLHFLDELVEKRTIELVENYGKDEEEQTINGVRTGLTDLDDLVNWLRNGEMIVVAARPSMGKTALANHLGLQALRSTEGSCVFVSAEMTSHDLTNRFVANLGSINLGHVNGKGKLTPDELIRLDQCVEQVSDWKEAHRMFIDDTSAGKVSMESIRALLTKAKVKTGNVSMVLIDYLQLIATNAEGSGDNMNLVVSRWSAFFKQIAKEYDCPVVVLSQLSRAVEQRNDKRPMLSDLRDSGAVEQDADVVIMLYRDDYYSNDTPDVNSPLELIVGKNRNGETGTAEVVFKRPFQQIVDKERYSHNHKVVQGNFQNEPGEYDEFPEI